MDGGGYYFDVFMNTFNGTFVSGDSITFQITSTVSGLAASDFAVVCSSTNTPTYQADTYYTVLQTYQSGKYYCLGAPTVVVPEPATVSLAVVGLLGGLGIIIRRRG